GERFHYHRFNGRRNCRYLVRKRWRGTLHMLPHYLLIGAIKGPAAGKPFVYDDSKSILVAGQAGSALEMFRCHIGCSARSFLKTCVIGTLSRNSKAKIAQQNAII